MVPAVQILLEGDIAITTDLIEDAAEAAQVVAAKAVNSIVAETAVAQARAARALSTAAAAAVTVTVKEE